MSNSNIDLSTHYLGMNLKNPVVPSASPLSRDLDNVKQMEDAGASAIVMYSLFEEQITHDSLEMFHHTSYHEDTHPEARSYFPEHSSYDMGPEEYLEHLHNIKKSVNIPVIASLNGCTDGGWTKYAKLMEEAGADALELNVYMLATDPNTSSAEIEDIYVETLRSVKANVGIPVAMKLSPYISALAHFAKRLDNEGVDGLVLFNRFYQPDIDLESLEVVPNIQLSNSQSMRLPLRWIAILYGKLNASLAATSGVYTAEDAIKLLMTGASVTQMFAALHKHGIDHIKTVLADMEKWMIDHEYESVKMMKGSMSHRSVANPGAFERANYMKALNSFK
jgi:dihydroorotate dehydrogenase (fumarate)